MRTSLLAVTGLIAAAFLPGCASVSSEEIARANFGPYPADYKAKIIQTAQSRPDTPANATFVFGKPIQGVSHGLFAGGGDVFGYIVPVEIIRPHGSEAHTPNRLHYFMIAEGSVTEVTERFVVGHARYVGTMTD